MDVEWSLERIKMKKEAASIIQVYTSLDHGKVSGQRAGHAVDHLGIHQDVEKGNIKEPRKKHPQNFVLITGKSTRRVLLINEYLLILTGFVVKIILLIQPFLIGNEKKGIMRCQNAMDTLAMLNDQKKTQLEFGRAVKMMLQREILAALKWNINHQNGQMKKLRNIFTINQEDQILINL